MDEAAVGKLSEPLRITVQALCFFMPESSVASALDQLSASGPSSAMRTDFGVARSAARELPAMASNAKNSSGVKVFQPLKRCGRSGSARCSPYVSVTSAAKACARAIKSSSGRSISSEGVGWHSLAIRSLSGRALELLRRCVGVSKMPPMQLMHRGLALPLRSWEVENGPLDAHVRQVGDEAESLEAEVTVSLP